MQGATIVSVLGTRPEVVKLAPVLRALDARPEPIRSVVIASGQHEDVTEAAISRLGVRVDERLGLFDPDQGLTDFGRRLFERLMRRLSAQRPDWLMVQGDTSTAVTSALVGHRLGIPVAHVESGPMSRHRSAGMPAARPDSGSRTESPTIQETCRLISRSAAAARIIPGAGLRHGCSIANSGTVPVGWYGQK